MMTIFPTLTINPDHTYNINFYGCDINREAPIVSMDYGGDDSIIELYLTILQLFINQYNQGYEDGYNDCADDFEDFEEAELD